MRHIGREGWGTMTHFIGKGQNNVYLQQVHLFTSHIKNKQEKDFRVTMLYFKNLYHNQIIIHMTSKNSLPTGISVSTFLFLQSMLFSVASHLSKKQSLPCLCISKPSMDDYFSEGKIQNLGHKKEACGMVFAHLSNFTLYNNLHLYNFSRIFQDNGNTAYPQMQVLPWQTNSHIFLDFSYTPLFFGLYTPAIANSSCFSTHHGISFLWAFVHFLPVCVQPTPFSTWLPRDHAVLQELLLSSSTIRFTFLFLHSHITQSQLMTESLLHYIKCIHSSLFPLLE